MKRWIAAILIAALSLICCTGAFAEESVSARTSVSRLSWEQEENLRLAVRSLDGVIVPSGSSFSFNAMVGVRSVNAGYRSARDGSGAIVTGGGVEQAATTLYLALNQFGGDIRFDEKHTYGFNFTGDYVSDGANAIQVDDWGSDFCFTNLGGALSINMYLSGDYLYCDLGMTYDGTGNQNGFLNWSGSPQYRTLVSSTALPLSGTDALINNVILAASSINDTVLLPGDLFSFNETVGPRSERYGYKSAVNGRGVKVVGGGVAQVASALWLSVKNLDGIAIVEKSTYGKRYNQNYVASSNDAILTDYTGKIDFSFRNSGSSSLTISTYVYDDVLYCELYRN